jgi:dTDP-glucose pyrophosphorylase
MVQLVIPMAGLGTRFRDAGWTTRKPFIPVDGKPMVQRVVETMRIPERKLTVVCLKEDRVRVRELFPDANAVVGIAYRKDGTACSVLAAMHYLDPTKPVLVANADQIVEWDDAGFYAHMRDTKAEGGVLTFAPATSTKWSYVEPSATPGIAAKIVANVPVSDVGVVGVYWWRSPVLLKKSIERMIDANDRTKGVFYLCPSLNHLAGPIAHFPCVEMWGTGTPEDLKLYEDRGVNP